jgi:hypothetical protein
MGSFLPADRGSLHAWTDSAVEDTLTRNMYYKTLNAALRSQKHYISCTPELLEKRDKNKLVDKHSKAVKTCLADNTGSEHLRACIPSLSAGPDSGPTPERVCYLYRWNDRGGAPAHHNEEPWGLGKLSDMEISTEDIIRSSVLANRHGFGSDQGLEVLRDTALLAWGPTAEFISDPSTPGMFSLPVCNTPYNWNGQTNGYTIHDDTNPWSARKSMPCYCGSLGNETQQVWSAMRLDISKMKGEYLRMLCPRQIGKKIKSPLERWIARCRLGIRKKGIVHLIGKELLCDVVISQLKKRGITEIGQLSEEESTGLICKIRQTAEAKCKRFRKTPIANVWQEAAEWKKEKDVKN